MKIKRRVSKKAIGPSIITMSIICIALASVIAVANAKVGGIAQYEESPGVWKNIYPELYVYPGLTVKIRIYDLPSEFDEYDTIYFNIAESGFRKDYTPTPPPDVGVYKENGILISDPIIWTCPDTLTYCETYTIKYKATDGKPTGDYVARGIVSDKPPWGGHLHFIPEFAFGTVMSLFSLLSGLAIYARARR